MQSRRGMSGTIYKPANLNCSKFIRPCQARINLRTIFPGELPSLFVWMRFRRWIEQTGYMAVIKALKRTNELLVCTDFICGKAKQEGRCSGILQVRSHTRHCGGPSAQPIAAYKRRHSRMPLSG